MSKAPRTGFRAPLPPASVRGPIMAYADSSEAMRLMGEAISRFDLSREELADILRYPASALLVANIASDPEIANRLKDMLSILTRVSEWTHNDRESLNWYCREFIQALGRTAADVVADGQGSAVLHYLDVLALGGFA